MFIELTDHLRCPADHEESYLILLPDKMDGRSVVTGTLGCPICGRTYSIEDGIGVLGDAPFSSDSETTLDGPGITALAGLTGPGGYLALVGSVASAWSQTKDLNPGVGLVTINPPGEVPDAPEVSVIRSGRIPLKSRSMRGVVLGRRYGEDSDWISEAARVVLPGLRVVGVGADPPPERIDLSASAGGVWVGTARQTKQKRERD